MTEHFLVRTGSGEQLHAVLMHPPGGHARRLVFIAPLVGSGASQQIVQFRTLLRGGSALLSFEYRGHGSSSGTFSIRKSVDDTAHALTWAIAHASEKRIPLHAVSTCYSTYSLLSALLSAQDVASVATISGVSSLFDLHLIIKYDDFTSFPFTDDGMSAPDLQSFLSGIDRGDVRIEGETFRKAVCSYLRWLFPELRVTDTSFEELSFYRVDKRGILEEFFHFQPLDGIMIPERMPCLFIYGIHDGLMGLTSPEQCSRYESRIRSLIPHAEVRGCDVDHFGRGPDREKNLRDMSTFFEAHEHR